MRDKGRAVLGIKEKESAILVALGWRHLESCSGEPCLSFSPTNKRMTTPELFDPGVFWPLFNKWAATELKRGDWQLTWMLDSGFHFAIIVDPRTPQAEAESMESETAAGIEAWYQCLSALGKIREG